MHGIRKEAESIGDLKKDYPVHLLAHQWLKCDLQLPKRAAMPQQKPKHVGCRSPLLHSPPHPFTKDNNFIN